MEIPAESIVSFYEKKLKGNWSAWTASNSLNSITLNDIKNVFENFDKKVKVRKFSKLKNCLK